MIRFFDPFPLKRSYLLIAVLLLTACRKDNSAFLGVEEPVNEQCLIAERHSADGKKITADIYDADSVLIELNYKEDGETINAQYLEEEAPGQFLSFEENKDPENAVSRVYLNDDRTIHREVEVILNDDGITYSENPEHQMDFIYNANKQLERIESTFEDKEIYDLVYDEENRIKKIEIHDGEGTTHFIYDNFTYDDHAKSDNLTPLVLFDSLTSYLIPSLRNVYITGYTITSPLDPLLDKTVAMEYKFSDKKVTEVHTKITASDGTVTESTDSIILNCK